MHRGTENDANTFCPCEAEGSEMDPGFTPWVRAVEKLIGRKLSMDPYGCAASMYADELLPEEAAEELHAAAISIQPGDTKKLIAWIDCHQPPKPTVDNGDGTLTVWSQCINVNNGVVTVERDVIEATLTAARNLLGY